MPTAVIKKTIDSIPIDIEVEIVFLTDDAVRMFIECGQRDGLSLFFPLGDVFARQPVEIPAQRATHPANGRLRILTNIVPGHTINKTVDILESFGCFQ